jgi:double-stranded RNA-specific adenosine deaminase
MNESQTQKGPAGFRHPDEPSGKRPHQMSSPTTNLNSIATASPHQTLVLPRPLNITRIREIKQRLSIHHNPNELEDVNERSWARMSSDAVWNKYRKLNKNAKNNDIIAGFIMQENPFTSKASTRVRVVALGSGTKCVGGDQLSCSGRTVHDSHAEVVARRSLIRWLYSQLHRADKKDSVAIRNEQPGCDKPFQLRPFKLWFYTSQTPCGDSAVYSHGKEQPSMAPCWEGNNNGYFRVKLEAGQGGTFSPKNMMQSIDGLRFGDRMMHNSCSDKIAKWSVVGVQGALLSRLIDPIFITGVVVGDLFSHGHICRALCCRSDYALKATCVELPKPFGPRHPKIRHAQLQVARSDRIKMKEKLSCNWTEHDLVHMEVVDGTTGRLEDGTDSRICKNTMFGNFIEIQPQAFEKSYSENKALAATYQRSKKLWKEKMQLSFGRWMDKPNEVEDFFFCSNI